MAVWLALLLFPFSVFSATLWPITSSTPTLTVIINHGDLATVGVPLQDYGANGVKLTSVEDITMTSTANAAKSQYTFRVTKTPCGVVSGGTAVSSVGPCLTAAMSAVTIGSSRGSGLSMAVGAGLALACFPYSVDGACVPSQITFYHGNDYCVSSYTAGATQTTIVVKHISLCTASPTRAPTRNPTRSPTTISPTTSPTAPTTSVPTASPTTLAPTVAPTTGSPTTPTVPTTLFPTTQQPTPGPTLNPTPNPTSGAPTSSPTGTCALPLGSATIVPTSVKLTAVCVADIDNDGHDEVIGAGIDDSLIVYTGLTLTEEVNYLPLSASGSPATAIVAADVDADGSVDMITVHGPNPSFIRVHGNSDGAFMFCALDYPVTATGAKHACAGDLDGDGDVDLAIVSLTAKITVMLNDGTGAFTQESVLTISATGSAQTNIVCADFNNDGKLDLAATSPTSSYINVFLGTHTPGALFGAVARFTNTNGGQPAGLAVGDFNEDGNLDLLASGDSGKYVFVHLGNGTGGFNKPSGFLIGSETANTGFGVVVADFDKDGHLDGYALKKTAIVRLTGTGTGTFNPPGSTTTTTNNYPNMLVVGDITGDACPDLVLANRDSQTIAIFPNSVD